MKNRRLNILFIAIIALAAAPQAFHDAYGLVNAAHERAETEFWSVFLSYQKADATETEERAATPLMATNRQQEETTAACQLERQAEAPAAEVARISQSQAAPARSRAQSLKGAGEKAAPSIPETLNVKFDTEESVVAAYTVRTVAFTETEPETVRVADLHARDPQKVADAAAKAAMASFLDSKENLRIKMKPLGEMDKMLRQRTRSTRDRVEYNYDTPQTVGSM